MRKPGLHTGLHHLHPLVFDTRINAESHKLTDNNLQIRLFLCDLIWIASQPFQYRREENPNQCNCRRGSWRHPVFCTDQFPPGLSTKKESPWSQLWVLPGFGYREVPITVCLDANSGSRAMMHVSPFGQDLGHSTSNDMISPFPNVRLAGHRSMMDIKRERLDTSNEHIAVSRFLSEARGNTNVLPTGSRSIGAPADLLYSQDGVPPNYESLSIRQYSDVPSTWFNSPPFCHLSSVRAVQ